MKETLEQKALLPDEEVIVKISLCNICDGIIRTAVKHMMTLKTKNSFAKEVMEHNLSVKEQSLLDYRKANAKWCECNKK